MNRLSDIFEFVERNREPHEHAWHYDEEIDEDNFICEECPAMKPVKEFDWDAELKNQKERKLENE